MDEDCTEKIQTCNDRLGVLKDELETLKNYSEEQSKNFKRIRFSPFNNMKFYTLNQRT